MRREIQIGSITWQNALPTPLGLAGVHLNLKPAWVPHVYLLHKATSNPAPPAEVADFRKFQESKHYRALTYCRCSVEIDDTTGRLVDFQLHEALHDPGWTPPFRFGECPPALAQSMYANAMLRDPEPRPCEASALSQVGSVRHANSALQGVPDHAQVLVSAVIKCRAGSRANQACVELGSPFHAPWIWNEWLLSHEGGQLKLHLRGSRYPSHAWYVNGRQVISVAGIGDAAFHEEPPAPPLIQRGMFVTVLPPRQGKWIHLGRLALYHPVLSKGAPTSDPQTPNGAAEMAQSGPLPDHANTVPGWRTSVVSL